MDAGDLTQKLLAAQDEIINTLKRERDQAQAAYESEKRARLSEQQVKTALQAKIKKLPLEVTYDGQECYWLGPRRDGKADGMGTVVTRDCEKKLYVGDMREGVPHGQGTHTEDVSEAHFWYEGGWKEGKMHGKAEVELQEFGDAFDAPPLCEVIFSGEFEGGTATEGTLFPGPRTNPNAKWEAGGKLNGSAEDRLRNYFERHSSADLPDWLPLFPADDE
ncbi:unnamed protein product [Vitrella brassicaformis CCMP3155]|uniref:Uncharacterized protein n=1 Tax=Vitrella brassicaformis (strain CCMP3155) TaxID=1169540 RepID=A0A0G4FLG7_VITBC|nr:unnamed protein product [Vitrella brassicaformis CCMP3155]|eukprot:CEM14613.1 unnamed protein product [Vitrella brassicaformis CCMP3155]